MIELNQSLLVGKGLHRECYVHPHQNDLCVKILFTNDGLKEVAREQAYYKLLQKRNIAWDILPRFYGNIETNLGPGAVFDLIKDSDGKASKSLEYYLTSIEETKLNYSGLSEAFLNLKNSLFHNKIITMTIKAKNIVYKRVNSADGALIIIDNIGNSDFIPISNYINFLAEKKILRKWNHFESSLLAHYPDNDLLKKIINSQNS
ncbi:MAG: hypothetical protein KKC46_05750 [Proteobacteria bacterium]|nr:hypothetical protein [Pseudomonadota bacterium]